jgi:hypothetical protein
MNLRKLCPVFFVAFALVLIGLPSKGRGELNVSINVNTPPPPAYVVQAPPPVVTIPGTYVYYAPDLGVDILFYQGFWYRSYSGRWYQARSYNGPWLFVAPQRVPRAIVMLPPDYHSMRRGHDRIPYGQLKKNWARWEKEKYWEGRPEWHDRGRGPHDDRGRDRDGGPREERRGDWDNGRHGDGDRDRPDHRGR